MYWLRVYVSVFIRYWDTPYSNPNIHIYVGRVESKIIWKIKNSPKDVRLSFILFGVYNTLIVLIKYKRINQFDYLSMLKVIDFARASKFKIITDMVVSIEKLTALYLVDTCESLLDGK